MKLTTKIKLLCITIAVAIVLICSCILVVYVINTLKYNTVSSSNALNKQTTLVLDSAISFMEDASLAPMLNPRIYNIFRKDYKSDEQSDYQFYLDKETVRGQFSSSVYSRNRFIYGITYISYTSDMVCSKNRGGYSPNLKDIKNQQWYKKHLATKSFSSVFSTEDDEMYPQSKAFLCVTQTILDKLTGKELGIIRVDMLISDLDYVWKNAKISQSSHLEILDVLGQPIYSTLENNNLPLNPENDGILLLNDTRFLVSSEKSSSYNYTLTSLTPVSYIYKNAQGTIILIIIAVLLCIAAVCWIAEVLAKRILKPIYELNDCMKAVRAGDLSVRSMTSEGGEFGEICESFNLMTDYTQNLISRIYKEEKEKREAEFQALQAQISPHFLLNTLNTIRWVAVIQGNKSIAKMLDDLSKMVSFTFRDTRDKITIDLEIQQLSYYIDILSVRYPNRFSISFDVCDDVLQCLTLKYLLQPFLENSIFHGFDGITYNGEINISIHFDEKHRVVYEITDNGNGMTDEQIKDIMKIGDNNKQGMNGIGISNAVSRVKLVYGLEYGINIESELNKYTNVTILIPEEYDKEG